MNTYGRIFLMLVLAFAGVFPARAAEPLTLEALISSAKENNPEIRASRQKWEASRARVSQEKTWDDPTLLAEYWSVPEGTLDLGAATEKMYGFSQMIPFPGKLAAKGKTARYGAEAMEWEYRDTERKVTAELTGAFARYYFLQRSIETYRLSADIMRSLARVAEARYAVGRSAQSEVLRAQVEAERMAAMLLTLEQEKETAKLEMNLLAGRPAEEDPGALAELRPVFVTGSWPEIRDAALRNSPGIRKAGAEAARSRSKQLSSKLEYLPDLEIVYRRKMMGGNWAGSDVMFGASFPLWFWKQRAGVKEAGFEREAAEAAKDNAGRMVVSRSKEVFTKLEATRRLIELYDTSVLPKSEQSLKVAQTAYGAGRMTFPELLDSVRAYLDFRLEYYTYVTDYLKDQAALERIAGIDLRNGGAQ